MRRSPSWISPMSSSTRCGWSDACFPGRCSTTRGSSRRAAKGQTGRTVDVVDELHRDDRIPSRGRERFPVVDGREKGAQLRVVRDLALDAFARRLAVDGDAQSVVVVRRDKVECAQLAAGAIDVNGDT